MEPLIRPEPTDEERRAILAALAEAEPRRPAVYESRWREAALEEGVSAGETTAASDRDLDQATAPDLKTRGASRA
jgi:hypothetical protein